jgi:hypothetical protein
MAATGMDHSPGPRVRALHGVGAAFAHHRGDPVGRVGADVGDLGGPFVAEGVEEPPQGRFVPPGRGPHQRAGVVIDHDHQVAVAALVGDLVDPDAA